MTTASAKKASEDIKRDLFSGDDATVRRAIAKCREEGNSTVVEPLIAFYASEAPEPLRVEVAEMLSTLKVSKVESFFADALRNPAMAHIHKDLVTFMWNSDLNPAVIMPEITQLAVKGDYAATLECLTFLENAETTIPEDQLLDSITAVSQQLSKRNNTESDKLLAFFLENLNMRRAEADSE